MPLEPSALERRLAEASRMAVVFDARAADHDREGRLPLESMAELRAAGWAALTVPQAHGGGGAGLRDAVTLTAALAGGCGSTALAFAMHLQTVATAAGQAWRGDAFARLCRAVVGRGALVNSCASEPELGSPSRGGLPATTARRQADGTWRIDGRKSFASLAPALDWVIVPAALEGEPEASAIGRFLVPAAAVRLEGAWDVLAMRATGSQDIVLDGVVVADEALLYRESAAVRGADDLKAAPWFTLLTSAAYLGVAEAALAQAAGLALRRVPSALGRPIASLESVQRRLGAGRLDLAAARGYLLGVAGAWDAATPAGRADLGDDVVAAKLLVARAALASTEQAMLVPGGMALSRALGLERRFRDARGAPYHPPSEDQGLVRLGRRLLADVEAAQKSPS